MTTTKYPPLTEKQLARMAHLKSLPYRGMPERAELRMLMDQHQDHRYSLKAQDRI